MTPGNLEGEIIRAEEIFAQKEYDFSAKYLAVHTGPHLGGFNQRTSLPELIESVGSMSALCIFGRYCAEKLVKSET